MVLFKDKSLQGTKDTLIARMRPVEMSENISKCYKSSHNLKEVIMKFIYISFAIILSITVQSAIAVPGDTNHIDDGKGDPVTMSGAYSETVTFYPPKSLNGTFIQEQVVACYDNNGNRIQSTDDSKYFCYAIQGISKKGLILNGKPIKYTGSNTFLGPILFVEIVDSSGKIFTGDIIGNVAWVDYKNCILYAKSNYALVCDKK